MDKISPLVIGALVIGLIVGFLLKGFIPQNTTAKNNQNVKAEVENRTPSAKATSSDDKIQQAMSAAPENITKNATILDYPKGEGATPTVLKQGSNDWTCFPDLPNSPGLDPMCLDKNGMKWLQAYVSKTNPNIESPGLIYMLAGGSDASNTDPFAQKPTSGDDWISTPPHIMVLPSGKLDKTIYGTDPKNGGSWIMWAGTPYEHLMVPIK